MSIKKQTKKATFLYTEFAIYNLLAIEKAMDIIASRSNGNMSNMLSAMQEERTKLIQKNPDHAKAAEIIEKIKTF